ncbi:MAG: hypothetical protein HOV92_17920 [Streptomyces sp.]|nr:hypothetical protein [Streptomyces sp.]
MPEPELHVRDLTPPIPVVVCDSGRHFAHPGETCEEIDELQALFRAYLERAAAEAWAEVERRLVYGEGTGEPRGFLSADQISIPYPLSDAEVADHGIIVGEPGPSPVERALAILDPHLRACPLYAAGPPAIYPINRKA